MVLASIKGVFPTTLQGKNKPSRWRSSSSSLSSTLGDPHGSPLDLNKA